MIFEPPARLLVHGAKRMVRARVHANLQRHGKDDRLGEEMETLNLLHPHLHTRPWLQVVELQELLCHHQAIHGPGAGQKQK